MVEYVEQEGQLFALIIRKDYDPEGTNFLTSKENSLQLGIIKHTKGYEIKPHIHNNTTKIVESIQEVLYIQRGKIQADFYMSKGKKACEAILYEGDTIILLAGGHGFNFLEDSKLIEIKQGPYASTTEDKTLL